MPKGSTKLKPSGARQSEPWEEKLLTRLQARINKEVKKKSDVFINGEKKVDSL
jgi:hypothetical protein